MKRTWDEIRNHIVDLGFEKSNVLTKQKDAFIRAVNVAQNYIAQHAYPLIESVEVTVVDNGKTYNTFDIDALASASGHQFLSFVDSPIYTVDGNYYIDEYEYRKEPNGKLLLPTDKTGTYTVFYKRYPSQITSTTEGSEFMDLEAKAADIIPYYVGHDLWADDDLSKATVWWNIAEQRLGELKEESGRTFGNITYQNTTGWW